MPKSPWYIHAQVVAATAPGITHGIRVMLRTTALPANSWSRAMPTAVPSRIWKTTDPAT